MRLPRSGRSLPARLRVSRASEEETAAGIYGLIVGAAVMAASNAESAAALTAAVLVTLVVYWSAERYARLVAERIHEGHRPSWRRVRAQLVSGWGMVTASVLPLAVLVLLRLLGVQLGNAVIWALIASTALLFLAGWEIGRHGHLSGAERLASGVVAGLFGVGLTALKALLH